MESLHERCVCERPNKSRVVVLVFVDADRTVAARAELEDGSPIEFNNRESFIDRSRNELLTIVEQHPVAARE